MGDDPFAERKNENHTKSPGKRRLLFMGFDRPPGISRLVWLPVLHEGSPYMTFPDSFVWGAAAASYQIEGAVTQDGRGPSVWDMMCRRPGAITNGDTGDIACDHYNQYRQDVDLMKRTGLQAYRFSIAWPRIFPEGSGTVNAAGLDFYDRLVDALLAAGIEPWATLFHWDFPLALYQRGGWLNPDSPEWFAEYAATVVQRLEDRVKHWMTLNEPLCFVNAGHLGGMHAPGDKLAMREFLTAAHHVLLAHGRAVQAIRAAAQDNATQVGAAFNGPVFMPETDTPDDIEAARQLTFHEDGEQPRGFGWYSDAALLGTYPAEAVAVFGKDMPDISSSDFDIIRQPLDFFGLNTYFGDYARADGDGRPQKIAAESGCDQTAFRWPVTPEVLRWGPRFLYERYGLPIVITENGMSNTDWVMRDGCVHDPQRIDFLHRHLVELGRAFEEDGVDIRAYFQWSIMDNFEWAWGYRERFGLIHIDYQTLKRTLKDSAYWYRDVIATNGGSLQTQS